jgi:hypothetical protein
MDLTTRLPSKSERVFPGVSALLFAASAAVTIGWWRPCRRWAGLPMPGG